MEVAKLIVDFIGKVIWPIIIFIIVWRLRKPIAARLKDINEIELPGGFKAKLDKVIEAKIEESTEKLEDPIINQSGLNEEQETELVKSDVGNILLAFTANKTQRENLKYNIYYDPVNRNHNIGFKYIGLYADKSIFAIGKLNKIVPCDYENGKLISTGNFNVDNLNADEYARITGIIENTDYYEIDHGVKFFLVDKFYETDYIKGSDYPIRAKKYIWLDDIEGFKPDMTPSQIATLLDGKEWE
jgi:hypothetical protein